MTLQSRRLLDSLAGEPLPEWERFARDVRVRHVAAGEALFRADQAWPWLAVVTAGLVKLVYPREDGGEPIGSFVAEGGFFASLAALAPNGRTSFAAVALTELGIEQIPYVVLREFGDPRRRRRSEPLPLTGEHTRTTLEGLGYDADTIATLIAAGVIQEHTGGKA